MDKRFWGILVAIAIVFVGIVWISNSKKANAPANGNTNNSQLSNHVTGQGAKGVTLVEYGDYQCPICGAYYPVVKQVSDKYSKDIYFQFRNFPLTSQHPNAFAGARAAEAAGLQNKYWEMHDGLYIQNITYYNSQQKDPSWISSSDPLSYFTEYAKQLGLNVDQFKKDYASDKVNNVINADLKEAARLNLDGTPSFFLDGKPVQLTNVTDSSHRPQLSKFSSLIDAAIAAKASAQKH